MKLSTDNKRKNKEPLSKKLVRIFCLFLAFLMVFGVVYYALIFLIQDVAAIEPDTDHDPLLAIGIAYGDDAEEGFEAYSTSGFIVGSTVLTNTSRSFTEVWRLNNTNVTAVIDYNLSRYGNSYKKEFSGGYVIGMYHIEAGGVISTRSQAESIINKLSSVVGGRYSVFPGYINGTYRVYIGDFSTKEKAETALGELSGVSALYSTRIIGTADTTVSVVDHTSNTVLFEYDCGASSYLGLEPVKTGGEAAYIKSSQNYLYPGVMMFKRVVTSSRDYIEAINLVNMETYITGVIPWEISNSWPFEVQRVFAIAARTFAVINSRRHFSSSGFDICPNQHCQAYRGCSRTNEQVLAAAIATKGMVITYNGKTASIAYGSSCGGETITATAAWGGYADPYFASIKTPWEQYADYENGIWQCEVSPYELCSYLYNKGYYQLTSGYISSITVNSKFGDTGYIYSITFTDSQGHSATVTTTDAIRTALQRYVYSANFEIGQGSLQYSYDVVTNIEVSIAGVISVPTGPAYPDLFEQLDLSGTVTAITGDGIVSGTSDSLIAITSFGRRAITSESASVLTSEGYKTLVNKIAEGSIPPPSYSQNIDIINPGELTPTDLDVIVDTVTVTKTYTASSSENYVFCGKGFGHGVGLSQYGALDLANAGVPAELIISTYFPGTELLNISQLID